MQTVHKYRLPPYTIAIIHGGPGAPGEMAPVAQELSSSYGILEPLQTAFSVDGQVEELKNQLEHYATLPVILIGYSWGALLGLMVAARYPALVKKLILIGCPPLKAADAKGIMQKRLDRLSDQERKQIKQLFETIQEKNSSAKQKNEAFAQIGEIFHITDSYSPLEETTQSIPINAAQYEAVWSQAAAMRKQGEFVQLANMITCPITIIHGEYDPHPIDGTRRLFEKKNDVRIIILSKCGHTPWIEKYAQNEFYKILREEVKELGRKRPSIKLKTE